MNRLLKIILVILMTGLGGVNARAQLYVVYSNSGLISEYDANNGALIDETLVGGLKHPHGICYDGGALYVCETESGTVSKYDARTGAAINEALVTGLSLPQAIAVADGVLYVGGLNQGSTGKIGKYNAVTGATMNPSLIPGIQAPMGLAVAGDKLFVAVGDGQGIISEYNATNGAVIKERFTRVNSPDGLAIAGDWLYVVSGGSAPMGAVFKFDLNTGIPANSPGFFRPLVTKLNYPTTVAVSGDDLLVANGGDTSIAKYNSTTGELLNAKMVPPLGDRPGGIAVVPKVSTGQYAISNAKYEVKTTLSNFALVLLMNENYFFLGLGIVVALVIVGLSLVFFRRPAPVMPAPVPAAVEVEAVESAEPSVEGEVLPSKPVPPEPLSVARLATIGLTIVVVTFVAAAIAGYFAYQWAITTRIAQLNSRGESGDMIGVWQYTNDRTRLASERPIFRRVTIYPQRMEYSAGSGSMQKEGQWRDDGFWCEKADSSGEVEVARLLDPEQIQLQVSAFDPSSSEALVLYKEMGSAAEMRELEEKYPRPWLYPPPAGIIKPGMTEYELKSLPWKPDQLTETGVEQYDRAVIYMYHSDEQTLDALQVTVKNHRVVLVKGGNG